MKNRQYRIAKGCNLGNSNNNLSESQNIDDFYYKGKLESVLDTDVLLYIAALSNTNFREYLKNDEEYQAFCEEDRKKDLDLSVDDYLRAQIKCLDPKYIEYADNLIAKTKKKYRPFFEKLEANYEQSKKGVATPLEFVDGVANLDDRKFLLHNVPYNTLEELQSRADLGIIASEWFGKLEKYSECRFCASFSKKDGNKLKQELQKSTTKQPQNKMYDAFYEGTYEPSGLTFIIDASAPALQPALRLDFFEYLRNKDANNLGGYTQDELATLKQIEEWTNSKTTDDPVLSHLNGGSNVVSVAKNHPDWSAIPAGVSSNYIVAVVARDAQKVPQEYLQSVGKMFDVPVLDEEYKVLYDCRDKYKSRQGTRETTRL